MARLFKKLLKIKILTNFIMFSYFSYIIDNNMVV